MVIELERSEDRSVLAVGALERLVAEVAEADGFAVVVGVADVERGLIGGHPMSAGGGFASPVMPRGAVLARVEN
ncbi:MAG: hypothetical protein H6705_07060 [Myxococcales bacterium]|nr:hypothetical protein [Myxococcales bacterium]